MSREMAKVEGGVLEANAEVFIVPNSFGPTDDFITFKERMTREMTSIANASTGNQIKYPIIVSQVWIVAEDDLDTENLSDHGGQYIDENGEVSHISHVASYLPAQLFEGKQEGDVVTVIIPKDCFNAGDDEMGDPQFDLKLNLTLAQTKYRYRNHGRFEEVFNRLMSKVSA